MITLNDLQPNYKKEDMIRTHDWCDDTTWPSPTDSSYLIKPANGEVIELVAAIVDFSQHAVMHSGGSIVVEGRIAEGGPWFEATRYESKADMINRFAKYENKDLTGSVGGGLTSNIMHLERELIPSLVIWPYEGFWSMGGEIVPKFIEVRIKIENDTQYYQSDGTSKGEMARCSYYAVYYNYIEE